MKYFLIYTAALLQIATFGFGFEHDIHFPTDERVWMPLDVPTARNLNEIWFAPESDSPELDELILLKALKSSTSVDSIRTKMDKNLHEIFYEKMNPDSSIVAYKDIKKKIFYLELAWKMNHEIYFLSYEIPHDLISDSKKNEWIQLFEKVPTANEREKEDWLLITKNRVFKEDKELFPNDAWYTYEDKRFNITIPSSWHPSKKSKIVNLSLKKTKILFQTHRKDDEASIFIRAVPTYLTEREYKKMIMSGIDDLKRHPQLGSVLKQTTIENLDGIQGDMLVLKKNNKLVYLTYYFSKGKTFFVQCETDQENDEFFKETFNRIFTSFQIKG